VKHKQKALVIGDDTRSFLATVRSLGRKGIEVHAAPFNMRAPALSSRYISQVHLLPYYLDGGAAWIDAMQRLMLAEQFDIVIPCEERSLLPLYKHQHDLPGISQLAIPTERALDAFFDKVNTRQLATQLGIPVAQGKTLLTTDTADTILAALPLPIVAKQRKSFSWPELYVRTSVKVIKDRSELDSWLGSIDKGTGDIFFEKMFPGCGLGVSVLCNQGNVLQAFEHHRAHELSGSSYYRKSAPLDTARLAAVADMVKAVGYTGLAMFEFKLNETSGDWILLEVNARPWGSMPLPVSMGVDFPYRLHQLLVNGEVTPPHPYKADVYGRNLIGDLWQLRTHIQSLAPHKGQQLRHLANWIAAFGRTLVGREHQDTLVLDDPRPGFTEIRQLFAEHLGNTALPMRNTPTESLAAKIQSTFRASNEPAHVVFVCQGNICRSPYAEWKAKQMLQALSAQVSFSSAGMLPRNSRTSPPVAVSAAAQHGIDLMPHRSRCVDAALLDSADAIVIFDRINWNSLQDRHPQIGDKVYLIGDPLNDRASLEIADPEGKDINNFLKTYIKVNTCLEALKNALQKGL